MGPRGAAGGGSAGGGWSAAAVLRAGPGPPRVAGGGAAGRAGAEDREGDGGSRAGRPRHSGPLDQPSNHPPRPAGAKRQQVGVPAAGRGCLEADPCPTSDPSKSSTALWTTLRFGKGAPQKAAEAFKQLNQRKKGKKKGKKGPAGAGRGGAGGRGPRAGKVRPSWWAAPRLEARPAGYRRQRASRS